jgi:hypothetical protein
MSKTADLRICAKCEWIFKLHQHKGCPQCGFASYGAHWAVGQKCYKYARTQELWLEKEVRKYRDALIAQLDSNDE